VAVDRTSVGGLEIGFTPFETRAELIVRVAQLADRSGFDGFGLAEAMGHAAPLLLAEVALTTEHLELSTSVLSVWSRTPSVLAMTAMGLQRMSDGRFVLGLGASTPPLVEGLHGIVWEDPVGKLRRVMQAVKSLLKGQRLPQPAKGARPLRLAVAAEAPVPVALASLSPPTVRLAGELADRWIPFLWPRSGLDLGRRLLHEGAAAGNRIEPPQICPAVPLAVGPDEASAQRVAARWLTVYCTQMGPIYPRMLRDRFGYAAEVDALLAANADRDVPVLPAASRRLAEDVLILATYQDITAAARLWTDAGADRIGLILPFGAAEEGLHAAVLAAAPEPGAAAIATQVQP
jgi:alkanesulfonate monooxygenase SsuD/methylene tetrahydromethanopterin reductase-like flavin-dependent oxidoreductase (luciferase family)